METESIPRENEPSLPDTGEDQAGQAANPLAAIESDINSLIAKCDRLSYDLEEGRKNAASDTADMLLDFIEVVDAFERVFRNITPRLDDADRQTKIWVSNFNTVYKVLVRALDRYDVKPMEIVIGEKASPYWHEVVEVVQDPDREDETMVEEIKKGYLWRGKLLRAAEVKAVKNS